MALWSDKQLGVMIENILMAQILHQNLWKTTDPIPGGWHLKLLLFLKISPFTWGAVISVMNSINHHEAVSKWTVWIHYPSKHEFRSLPLNAGDRPRASSSVRSLDVPLASCTNLILRICRRANHIKWQFSLHYWPCTALGSFSLLICILSPSSTMPGT